MRGEVEGRVEGRGKGEGETKRLRTGLRWEGLKGREFEGTGAEKDEGREVVLPTENPL